MMPVAQLIALLQKDLTRKSHSLAEYMAASSPYVGPGQEEMWELLLKLRSEEQEQGQRLSRLIVSLGGVPNPGLFDASAADMNYLNIVHLFKILIRAKKESTATFEQRLGQVRGWDSAFVAIGDILDAEKRQLTELESCLARHRPEPKVKAASSAGPPVVTAPAVPKPEDAKPKFDLQAYLAAHKGTSKQRPTSEKAISETSKPTESKTGPDETSQPKPKFDLQAFIAAKKSQPGGAKEASARAEHDHETKNSTAPKGDKSSNEQPTETTEKKPFDLQTWLKSREKKE